MTLASGQTLSGIGSVKGNFTVGSGAILSPGLNGIGTLTFSNSLTLASGSTNIFGISKAPLTNDAAKIFGALTNGGTLIVTNIGAAALADGNSFKLFNAASYNGAFASVILPPLPAGLAWNTNSLNTNGTLSVVVATKPFIASADAVRQWLHVDGHGRRGQCEFLSARLDQSFHAGFQLDAAADQPVRQQRQFQLHQRNQFQYRTELLSATITMSLVHPMREQQIISTRKKLLFGLLAIVFGLLDGHAQQLAFPGAQGFGKYATGGRGGTVYHVTSLADDGSAGTFREAVGSPNRIIVFDVGGYINLCSAVSASSSLTIAGQTAPGGGIGLMGAELSFYGQTNIICRDLRVRQGGSSTSQSGINIGSSSGGAGNMIFDHTSVEFGQWDSVDAVNTANFTVQYCIIADPINQQFGAHVEGSNASYVNNLWVNAHNRQPLAKANTVYINNVVYDYQAGYTVADTAGHFSHDIINNYFITGPSTTSRQQ